MSFSNPVVRAVRAAVLGVAGVATPALAVARDVIPGPIAAHVVRVVDGDTLIVRARIWLGQEVETAVRLDGIDTPEIKGKCDAERRMAIAARDVTRGLAESRVVLLRDVRYGKYAGRVLARIETGDGMDLGRALLERGLGRPYRGGPRGDWCENRDSEPGRD